MYRACLPFSIPVRLSAPRHPGFVPAARWPSGGKTRCATPRPSRSAGVPGGLSRPGPCCSSLSNYSSVNRNIEPDGASRPAAQSAVPSQRLPTGGSVGPLTFRASRIRKSDYSRPPPTLAGWSVPAGPSAWTGCSDGHVTLPVRGCQRAAVYLEPLAAHRGRR